MKVFLSMIFLIYSGLCTAQPADTTAAGRELKRVQRQVREIFRLQLPVTLQQQRNGGLCKRSFSLDFKWADADSSYVIEVPEKLHDTLTEVIKNGSKYIIPFERLDVAGVRLVQSEDGKTMALLLPALPGQTFTWHPFYNAPDEAVSEVTFGWYEQVQDRTMARLADAWKDFLEKLTAAQIARTSER